MRKAVECLRDSGTVTIIIIAHRLSTIRHADQILVLRNGHIIEQGEHDQLCSSDGWYAKNYRIQGYSHIDSARGKEGTLIDEPNKVDHKVC